MKTSPMLSPRLPGRTGALQLPVLALAAVLVVLAMSAFDLLAGYPRFGVPGTVSAALVAIVLNLLLLKQLVLAAPGFDPYPGRSHAFRLGAVICIVISGAAAGRSLMVPATFGEFGRWRGDAWRDAMTAREPAHQGKKLCATCHAREFALHEKDMHFKVECESCHGEGKEHVKYYRAAKASPGTTHGPKPELFVPHTKEPCLWCHRRLDARPQWFPQIDAAEHFAFLGVKDPATRCTQCHNPHEPLFLDRELAKARLHPFIQQCRDCHSQPVSSGTTRPANHPAVFECSYCHAEVAKDFATKPHAKIGCGRCHIFHKESDSAGRIIKNRNPQFCLLCHKANGFRGPGAPPLIEWPQHKADMGGDAKDETTCIDCHFPDKIHGTIEELRKAAAKEAGK